MKIYDVGPDGKRRLARPTPTNDPGDLPGPRGRRTVAGPRWRGCVSASVAASMLVILIPIFSLVLMALSVLGTFYGARGLSVPVETPLVIWANIREAPWIFGVAAATQAALSIAQWGGRQLARADRRWWVVYGAALSLSVYWNWNGYWPTLEALGVPWLLALAIIAFGDIEPEVGLIRGG